MGVTLERATFLPIMEPTQKQQAPSGSQEESGPLAGSGCCPVPERSGGLGAASPVSWGKGQSHGPRASLLSQNVGPGLGTLFRQALPLVLHTRVSEALPARGTAPKGRWPCPPSHC